MYHLVRLKRMGSLICFEMLICGQGDGFMVGWYVKVYSGCVRFIFVCNWKQSCGSGNLLDLRDDINEIFENKIVLKKGKELIRYWYDYKHNIHLPTEQWNEYWTETEIEIETV